MNHDEQKQQHEESCSRNSGRKRLREGSTSSPSTPTVTNLSLNDDQDNTMPSFKSLSLEAIFHPKFENESRNDQTIRCQMKESVETGKGYIEVSLKHSGSLLLWSGGQRYYSKNSTENQFTYVGEVLLRQHFYRAFHTDSSSSDVSLEANYQECSEYVKENRLTLAFEVVTAILGHHGDIPQHDFLILTAVADRNMERFYSTCELVQFAQKFRLPHNDTWVFDSERGVNGLFHLYDTTRESGLAQDTVAALNGIADMHVSSMYPHTVFQGNILEGIVIRYVPYHDKTKEQETMRDLAAESQRILQAVPPETPPSFVLTKALPDGTTAPPVLTTDLRDISRKVMATGDREKVSAFLETTVHDILCSSDEDKRRSVERKPLQVSKEWTSTFPAAVAQALANQDDMDQETRRILKLIDTLDSLNTRVDFRIVKESTNGQPDRWLCIVHVFYDTTHQKFRRKMEPNDMTLFRGFCIELGTNHKENKMNVDNEGSENLPPVDNEASGLMLKMKFLPYMVRTFGCRNGLQVVAQRGPQAFTDYTMKLMTRWDMSQEAKAKWQPFFSAWGKYAHMCLTEEAHEYSDPSLPKLCDTFYLDHLEHFTRLYENGDIVGDVEEQSPSTSTFRGLIFVVGLDREISDLAADTISERLGGVVVRKGLDSMAQEDWDAACLSRRVGMICSATAEDGVKRVRKKMQDCGDAMFAVLVGCDEVAVLSHCAKDEAATEEGVDSTIATRKLGGKISAWRKTRFAQLCEISYHDFFNGSKVDDDEDKAPTADNNAMQKLLNELNGASAALPKIDDRPGLLVFFPGIPGSGKTTLCSHEVEEDLRCAIKQATETERNEGDNSAALIPPRPVIIRVGDEVKKKYWPLVKVEKTKNPSSVYIADKNTPPAGWASVAQVCSTSNGVAVPVMPDAAALQTTSIKGAGHYPFSLHYLAVCMTRVLARPPESHSGKLDRSTDLACMVVVKFFSLYRGIAADELLPSIQGAMQRERAAMSSSPITVPFFAQEELPSLPSELEDALNDAIRIQYEYDVILDEKMSRKDDRVDEIETRLRALLEKHNDMLLALAADPAVSKQALVSQVAEQEAALSFSTEALDGTPRGADFVKITSIDVSQALAHSTLRKIAEKHTRVSDMLAKLTEEGDGAAEDETDDGVIPGENFVADTHITMVHCSQMSQGTIQDQFEPLIGCAVNVTVTGLLWNQQIAALAVEVASNTKDKPDLQVPAPKNVFPHITIWHQQDVSAAYSNELPQLVESGKAERIDFDEPVVIQGFVSLWGEDRG